MIEPATLPNLLTYDEVAKELRVSKWTVKREIKRGHLRVTKIGQRPRVREDDLLAYIDRGRMEQCQGNETTAPDRSATAGSPSGQIAQPGAEPGSTPKLDRHAAHRSAQRILKKRS